MYKIYRFKIYFLANLVENKIIIQEWAMMYKVISKIEIPHKTRLARKVILPKKFMS
jgi:hypothetical protein